MELKPIRSKKEYQIALAEVERLWDAPAESAAADRLDVLAMLEMIRRLADGLQLPAEVLIKPYRLRREAGELEAA